MIHKMPESTNWLALALSFLRWIPNPTHDGAFRSPCVRRFKRLNWCYLM